VWKQDKPACQFLEDNQSLTPPPIIPIYETIGCQNHIMITYFKYDEFNS
jgi:hypothetical protein